MASNIEAANALLDLFGTPPPPAQKAVSLKDMSEKDQLRLRIELCIFDQMDWKRGVTNYSFRTTNNYYKVCLTKDRIIVLRSGDALPYIYQTED